MIRENFTFLNGFSWFINLFASKVLLCKALEWAYTLQKFQSKIAFRLETRLKSQMRRSMFTLGLGTLVPLIPAANGLVLLGLLYPTQQGGTRKLEAPTSQDEIGVTLVKEKFTAASR